MTAGARAALWMIGSIVSFTLMAVAGRQLAGAHDTFEIMLYRSALGLALVVGAAAATGTLRDVRRERLGLHTVRNFAHFTGQNLWFASLAMIPLAQVFAMEFTSPLWVLLLAPPLLGERVRPAQYAVAALGFAGVLAVARPWGGAVEPGLLLAGLAAVFFALTNLMTRRLTRTDGLVSILFWLTAIQLLLGLVAAGHDGQIAPPTAATAPWLAAIGVAGLCAHLCLTKALGLAPASTVMPVDFLRLPVIAAVGALAYGESLAPEVAFGAALIVGASWANLRLAARAPAGNVAPAQPNAAKAFPPGS
ncbi:DMT family transporter [Jannaschia sp. W003]|uniref:DMT family transporter n=1 Tax=Jannaschia sp. W003 TaxID=2867012 RepID=UPI0021A9150B|nr:DMT family transporter [Jannaschia sp. W003]UWQ20544.1 DMT family transporter [Jannaschia sp. W003]